ncbi:UPF0255 protein [Diplodia seriata]|uniref:UPF0255 protein n=1 Tax=Diplodia seriata TaxID=420778 RepID=A0A1S8B1P3_9PEZI|nr:UPF0255 protein [Diplodia seriata]
MAARGKYFIQDKLQTPAAHHESFAKLWETKWKEPAEMGVYPFMFGTAKDFEPIVEEMTRVSANKGFALDPAIRPQAEKLTRIAEEAEAAGEREKASEYYLRSSAVWRISRFPAPRSEKQRYAWEEGKKVCLKGLQLREHPVQEVLIPHRHAAAGEGSHIPVYHQLPAGASKDNPAPVVVIITGLDGYRTELAVWMEGWRQQGVGTVVVEIPGTADSPASKEDPLSPDRQWSSLLDWLDEQEAVDHDRVAVWAFSTGGFYAIRLAYTHPHRVAGIVSLGGGCHHMFDKEWLDQVNHLEYPFDEAHSLAYKFGYGDDVEKFKQEAHKYSLLNDGTLDKPDCTRLLLVNGTDDEIFPIDDYYVALQHGPSKEARFVPNKKHMGEPESFFIIMAWIYKLFGIKGDARQQLSTMPFKPKY